MVKGVERMTEGRSIATLEAERDSSLRAILSLCTPANDRRDNETAGDTKSSKD